MTSPISTRKHGDILIILSNNPPVNALGAAVRQGLVEAIGARQARRYFLTGERFEAADAYRLGLLHDIVPLGQLDDRRHDRHHPERGPTCPSRIATDLGFCGSGGALRPSAAEWDTPQNHGMAHAFTAGA